MKIVLFLLVSLFTCTQYVHSLVAQETLRDIYHDITQNIVSESLKDSVCYNRLAEMCDTYGSRLSGSKSLEQSIDWIIKVMKQDGFDSVWTEPVKVPHWVRGKESLEMISPRKHSLQLLGLGGTISTPANGLTGEIVAVKSFAELAEKAAEVKGKIVLFNVPFTTYGETVQYRVNGAVQAAKYGAIASLVRSVGSMSLYTPHTGAMYYNDSVPKIPHAAITSEDADMLDRMYQRKTKTIVQLILKNEKLPDADSRNVLAEIKGSEKPDEIVVFGGHIDSWDVGQGAMDDGGGCFISWEALRIIKKLGLKPKRTMRVVFWTNEENGLAGGKAYAKAHAHEIEKHVLAIESDAGTFKPKGFECTGNESNLALAREMSVLLGSIDATIIQEGGGGADIGPLIEKGVPGMELLVEESKYFRYHHTNADTIDKLNPYELNLCSAAMAIMAYIGADMPKKLSGKK